jgi:hypothetical protein
LPTWSLLLALALPSSARGAELERGGVELWGGGGAHATTGFVGGQLVNQSQLEADGRLTAGWFSARLDLDLHLNPAAPGVITTPYAPEWAMVQVGQERFRLRGGVLNPMISLEDWDEWDNYLPTYSLLFSGASLGRVRGAEAEVAFDDGTAIFAFAGQDLDFGVKPPPLVVGVGVSSEQDAFGTWSGVAAYPSEGWYAAYGSVEVYPLEPLSVALDTTTGLSAGAPFFVGQLVINALPEAAVQPVARYEALWDPEGAVLAPAPGLGRYTASLGARYAPADPVLISLEGKLDGMGLDPIPGVFLGLSLFQTDPEAGDADP